MVARNVSFIVSEVVAVPLLKHPAGSCVLERSVPLKLSSFFSYQRLCGSYLGVLRLPVIVDTVSSVDEYLRRTPQARFPRSPCVVDRCVVVAKW